MSKRQSIFTVGLMIISALVGAIISNKMVVAESGQAQQMIGQAASEARKYEYRTIFGGAKNGSLAITDLNRLGEQGYEVAGHSTSADLDGRQNFSVLLRRVKP